MFQGCWVSGGEIRACQACYESWRVSALLYIGYFECVSREGRVILPAQASTRLLLEHSRLTGVSSWACPEYRHERHAGAGWSGFLLGGAQLALVLPQQACGHVPGRPRSHLRRWLMPCYRRLPGIPLLSLFRHTCVLEWAPALCRVAVFWKRLREGWRNGSAGKSGCPTGLTVWVWSFVLTVEGEDYCLRVVL